MYSKIQQEKDQGFSREAATRHLGLSWRTVDRFKMYNLGTFHYCISFKRFRKKEDSLHQ